jgi:hypothetical protein
MPHLTDPRITDLLLDQPEEDLGFIPTPSLRSLVCEDIDDAETIECLTQCLDISHLTLIRCTIGSVHRYIETVTLKEIDRNIGDFLESWLGKNLYLDSCPGFDGDVLENMYSIWSNRTAVYPMEFLKISNCLDFSVTALQLFVESREHPDGDYVTLQAVCISGNSP